MDSNNTSTPLRILLVEDNEHDWLAFRRAFQKSHVPSEIRRYVRAEEALERLVTDPSAGPGFDLVVTDYKLPGMTGLELCQELLDREVPLPLVLLTGAGTEHLAVEALKAGVDDYLIKDPDRGYLELLPVVLPDVARKHGDRLARQRAEAALRESEERLRLLVQNMPVMIDAIDTGGHFVLWNRECEQVTGYSADEIAANPRAMELLYPDPDRLERVMEEVAEHVADFRDLEWDIQCKDGSVRTVAWANISNQIAISGWAQWAIGVDITERKRVEQTLTRRNRELALLNRASQAFTATLDLDQVLVTVLEEVRGLLDVTSSSIWLSDPETNELVCHQATGPQSEAALGWRLAQGEGIAGWVARSGESLIVPDTRANERHFKGVDQHIGLELRSILSVPLQVKQDVIGVLQVVDTDVDRFKPTDLRLVEPLAATAAIAIENARLYQQLQDHAGQLEQRVQERTAQLQAQYARLEAILGSASGGIVVADGQGQVVQANPVAQAWLTRTLSPEDAARLRKAVRDLAMRAEERPEAVLELTGLDLELKAAPISEPGLEKAAAVVAVHDVSHLKALDRMKTRFVTNISHELRTPITTIKLYAHLMQQQPERWQEHLAPLTQEADHQARLVADILQISRIDAGRLEMEPRPTPLDELTEVTIVSHQMLAQERGLTLEHRPAEPGTVALVDPQRMTQTMDILLTNAIQYTPPGGEIAVSTGREEAKGRVWAMVRVTDTGMGIPEEELPHVFDRFFRGQEPRSMQVSGTGLGLAIVKAIMELHGGWVTVESQVRKGTTFTIWLPLAD